MFLTKCLGNLEAKYTGTVASVYMILAMFLCSILAAVYKFFIGKYSLQRLLLSRYFVAIIINTWIITRGKNKIYFGDQPRVQRGLYYRMILNVFLNIGLYGSIGCMPVTDVIVISELTPIVTGILNAVFFKGEYTK